LKKTLIIAHRGASKLRPENTIPAFELALKQNADGIEGDFQLTQDKQIVCLHDSTTDRVAGTRKVVKDSTLAELKKLDVGRWFNQDWQGLTIPTLTEVLDILPPDKKLFMEVKCGVEIISSLLSILNHYPLTQERLVILSFNCQVLKAVKNRIPALKVLLLSRLKFSFKRNKLSPSPTEILNRLESINADGFSSRFHLLLDQIFIDKIKQAGYEYHIWTVDQQKLAQKFTKMGVNSITTNRPHLLVN
jgi:glycerophosphoryl diester phosphodiesterase